MSIEAAGEGSPGAMGAGLARMTPRVSRPYTLGEGASFSSGAGRVSGAMLAARAV